MTTSMTVTVEDLLANAAWARRLARNLLHDGDQADDLVQETWMAALRAKPDRQQPLRPWLGRVLRNRAANRSRADARREAHHQRAGSLVAGSAGADPEELVSRIQAQRLLAELITLLREPNRQTVLLRYYEGLTSDQIGGLMGVPAGTVRRRLKDALDELRHEMDRRHQGNREAWLGALLPLFPAEARTRAPTNDAAEPGSPGPAHPGAAPPPSEVTGHGQSRLSRLTWLGPQMLLPRVAVGALVATLGAGGVLLWRASGGVPARPVGPAATGTPGNPPGGGGHSLAAALPASVDACRALLVTRRKELSETEARYREIIRDNVLFEEGAANPTARAALLPELQRILGGDAGAGPGFTLECRTWACQVLVLSPSQVGFQAAGERARPITSDRMLGERIRSWIGSASTLVTDPVSKTSYWQTPRFLKLKAPSGARIAGMPPATDPDERQPPLPGTLPACRSEIAAVDRKLAERRTTIEREETPLQIYLRASPNPSLTREFQALVARALPTTGTSPSPQVTCRASVCRVELPGLPPNGPGHPWMSQLEKDPEVRRKIGRKTLTSAFMIYEVAAPRSAAETVEQPVHDDDRFEAVIRQFNAILDAADMAGCEKRFPATGKLQITLVFYPTTNPPGAGPDPFEVKLAGPLADTPLARCLGEGVTREARKAAFSPGRHGYVEKKLEFPLARSSPKSEG